MVRVTNGVSQGMYPMAGSTVSAVRTDLELLYGISERAVALVNGVLADEGHVLLDDDELDFVIDSGQKGVGKVWTTAEQFCQDFKIEREDLDQWIASGLRVCACRDGSVRITETAVDEFVQGRNVESPYLTVEEAAVYLRTTVKGIYAFVERGRLKKCPGTRTLLFTRKMLDDCVKGE